MLYNSQFKNKTSCRNRKILVNLSPIKPTWNKALFVLGCPYKSKVIKK